MRVLLNAEPLWIDRCSLLRKYWYSDWPCTSRGLLMQCPWGCTLSLWGLFASVCGATGRKGGAEKWWRVREMGNPWLELASTEAGGTWRASRPLQHWWSSVLQRRLALFILELNTHLARRAEKLKEPVGWWSSCLPRHCRQPQGEPAGSTHLPSIRVISLCFLFSEDCVATLPRNTQGWEFQETLSGLAKLAYGQATRECLGII